MAVGGAWVLGRVTDEVVLPAFDGGVSGGTVAAGAAAIVGVSLLRSLGVVGRRYYGMKALRGMQRTWFVRLTDTYLRVPLSYFGRHPAGRLLAHADADVERAVTVLMPLPFSLGVIVLIGLSIVSLALIDPLLMLIGLALFPALALINQVYSRRVEVPAAATQARLGDVATVAHESFEGALVVKSLGLEDREVDRLRRAADGLRTARLGVGRLRATFEPGLDALPNLGMVALVAVGSWRISTGAMSTGELVQAVALFGILTFPMRVVGFLLEEMPRAVVAADRIDLVLATPSRPRPAPDSGGARARRPHRGGRGRAGVRLRGRPRPRRRRPGPGAGRGGRPRGGDGLGEVDAVPSPRPPVRAHRGHRAPERGRPAPRRARLDPGARGACLPGGLPVRRHRAREPDPRAGRLRRRRAVGARPGPADRFVARLPHGLDQELGERGVTLSGGQRQRLALARALLRRPGLLMLDDATSAVDATIEQQILEGLRTSLHATTLIVAHRVSTIALADRVVFLEGGRIAAQGSHADLVATVPAYAALARAYQEEPA